jgi:hypothetical protein
MDSPPAAGAAARPPARGELAEQVLEVGQQVGLLVGEGVVAAPQREVDLEHGLEDAPVGGVLHERGGERVLERLAVVDGDVLHRLHGVEVLGEADRQAGGAQLGDEARQQLGQATPVPSAPASPAPPWTSPRSPKPRRRCAGAGRQAFFCQGLAAWRSSPPRGVLVELLDRLGRCSSGT